MGRKFLELVHVSPPDEFDEGLMGLPADIWTDDVFPKLEGAHARAARLACKAWAFLIPRSFQSRRLDVFRLEAYGLNKVWYGTRAATGLLYQSAADQCLQFTAFCVSLRVLTLTNVSLCSLPRSAEITLTRLAGLGNLKQLRSLTLVGKKGGYLFNAGSAGPLPSTFSGLSALEHIHLEYMWIINDVEVLSSIATLRQIVIKRCKHISEIPQGFSLLPQLRQLIVASEADGPWSAANLALPDFSSGFPKLKALRLSGQSSLVSLPASIVHLSRLTSLDVSYCTALAHIPDIVFVKVERLCIVGCSRLLERPENLFQPFSDLQIHGPYVADPSEVLLATDSDLESDDEDDGDNLEKDISL